MAEYQGPTVYERCEEKRRIGWGAIIAGVVLAIVIQFMLSILGAAIGLTAIEPRSDDNPAGAIMTGAMIWWLISSFISLFIGAWTAAKMSGVWSRCNGALHGLVTWAVTVILTLLFLTSAIGNVIGGALNVFGKGVSAVSAVVGKVAPEVAEKAGQLIPGDALGNVEQEVKQIIQQADTNDAQQVLQDVMQPLTSLLRKGADASDADKKAVADVLVEEANMTPAEAQRTVDKWLQNYEQATQKIKETAKDVREQAAETAEQVASKAVDIATPAAWWTFFMLLLGAIVAAIGGCVGTQHDHAVRMEKTKTTT
ncbi:MAG: hypothetical protein A2Y10_06635 [Planctomycetes bacterium GWF2_41_51]|nr:MAG: hypothetical protein A2Y10_06635 [Planctomycetes bacterium GWF2_41_51]HBG28143.1 hypothetical protein [Phycisphaerales bacterium]